MKNKQSQFAVVCWFDVTENRGYLRVAGEPRDIWFNLDTQRQVADGLYQPEFGQKSPKETQIPVQGSHVMVSLRERYEQVATRRGYRSVRMIEVEAWNYCFEFKDSERRIASRPVYKVTQFAFTNGQLIAGSQFEAGKGTFEVLRFQFENQRLPTKVLDLYYNYRVERMSGDVWVDCTAQMAERFCLPAWHYEVDCISPKAQNGRAAPLKKFSDIKIEKVLEATMG
ncbi:MAG: hypothetical protein A3H57_01155 [Candidatus Taylorbacteria bacterium RIFCSPLOWO2_02_FULL_43_11]|uniref:Uncharacterized protein n=1 Tax=Candidatus Taylorbacteria bacterium RIFCSPHIGHO2_02_FULL_43_32b TaxID=1802306 RepID=A0A1G2MHJ3_9BACT|nr:MAG: hypothetical protein A2743_01850 [Candidatus Taylorbacteria bacterium RIFCSPHIGHO2_01_FULL_43_47]OHA23376.1 MAG: hypothetical protein A3C72_00390 [Candidatus Taylorbacteria bacterium RIFCSPHIGHO2_02_FULL_43_32b]OHA30356.1 MAG: hypothetical protein A3B08_03600 [Candidatus Taylorbacteria bacterium RIFCSPLOWO2_01_FULL_43_44]OHA36265.1 MAG: hypothetical protein A3H57_01155 [Candidatus Taylorbacteria bacterium RIFCSPLOWO2_02_FULL_43_11]